MVWEKKEEFNPIPAGTYVFEIYKVGEITPTAKGGYRQWKLDTFNDGERVQLWINLFGSSKILEAIGLKEEVNNEGEKGFNWSPEQVIGEKFKATLSYEPNKDNTRSFPRLSDIEKVGEGSEIPF